jgi:hypothetical protein
MKPLDGAFVRAANDAYAGVALSEARSEELPIELGQLRAAIETVRQPVSFEAEPSDFRAALLALAEEKHP